MSSSPFFPFYPSDWLSGTRGLTAVETGIYITLIAMMYEREAPLDMPDDRLARLCGASVSIFKKALEGLVAEGKIQRLPDGLWNDRVGKECRIREEKKNSASTSAKTRWEKTLKKQSTEDANALSSQCETDANQNPESEEKEREPNGSPKKNTRGSRLKPDWQLPKPWGDEAVGKGLPPETVRREGERFKNYWLGVPGQKGVKLDWLATWRNWIDKRVNDAVPKPAPQSDFWTGKALA